MIEQWRVTYRLRPDTQPELMIATLDVAGDATHVYMSVSPDFDVINEIGSLMKVLDETPIDSESLQSYLTRVRAMAQEALYSQKGEQP